MSLANDFLQGRQSSVMIKLKLENCLNVLKIVSKEPVDILLLLKEDHLPISCSQFLLASGEKLKQVGYF